MFLSYRIRPPPSSTLFPYTTLFRGKLNRPVVWAGAGCLVLAAGGVAFLALPSSGVPHVLVVPDQIGSYTKQPSLAKKMDAAALQKQIVAKSADRKSVV